MLFSATGGKAVFPFIKPILALCHFTKTIISSQESRWENKHVHHQNTPTCKEKQKIQISAFSSPPEDTYSAVGPSRDTSNWSKLHSKGGGGKGELTVQSGLSFILPSAALNGRCTDCLGCSNSSISTILRTEDEHAVRQPHRTWLLYVGYV